MEFEGDRLSLGVDSPCSVFSRSKQKWLEGIISNVFIDKRNAEWLVVKYGNKSKNMQRFCEDLRCVQSAKDRVFGWEELTSPPWDINIGNQFSNIVSINAMEFAIASEMTADPSAYGTNTYSTFCGGIYVYSVIVNDWMLLREYPKKIPFLKSTKLSLSFNPNTYELFLYGVHENALHSVLAKINIYSRKFKYTTSKSYTAGIGATALIIDGQFHLLGGAVSNNHAVYNEKKKEFDILYPIWDGNGNKSVFSVAGNVQHGVIYNSYKGMLWVLGGGANIINGTCTANGTDVIWAHDLNASYYHLTPDAAWNQLKLKMPHRMSSFGCCMCYGKFIITFGGVEREKRKTDVLNDIFIMNSDRMKYDNYNNYKNVFEGKSTVPLPLPSKDLNKKYSAVVLAMCPDYDSNLMIAGFIKNYVCKGFDTFISLDIIDLIFAFSNTEYVYLMQTATIKPRMWRICVDDILNSMVPI